MARNKPSKNRERKTKINLVFDENKRREFLGGFHKRKVERRKKAQEELKQMLKEEKKRIKQENKESYKKLVVSSRPIPELERLLQEEYSDQEEEVSIKIMELPSAVMSDTQRCIGENRPSQPKKRVQTKRKELDSEEELPGMGLEERSEQVDDDESGDDTNQVNTKKDVKRMLKRQATQKVQKSKAFQLKNKMERLKNKKKSRRTKNNNEKVKAAGKNPRKIQKKAIGRRKK